jgi:hypothetical protein
LTRESPSIPGRPQSATTRSTPVSGLRSKERASAPFFASTTSGEASPTRTRMER